MAQIFCSENGTGLELVVEDRGNDRNDLIVEDRGDDGNNAHFGFSSSFPLRTDVLLQQDYRPKVSTVGWHTTTYRSRVFVRVSEVFTLEKFWGTECLRLGNVSRTESI